MFVPDARASMLNRASERPVGLLELLITIIISSPKHKSSSTPPSRLRLRLLAFTPPPAMVPRSCLETAAERSMPLERVVRKSIFWSSGVQRGSVARPVQ